MSHPVSRHFQNAIWQEAFEKYMAECGQELWKAPQWVQDEYKQRARKDLCDYLATCGIV